MACLHSHGSSSPLCNRCKLNARASWVAESGFLIADLGMVNSNLFCDCALLCAKADIIITCDYALDLAQIRPEGCATLPAYARPAALAGRRSFGTEEMAARAVRRRWTSAIPSPQEQLRSKVNKRWPNNRDLMKYCCVYGVR